MRDLALPIWIMREEVVESPPAREPCDGPGHAVAFTAPEHLIAYLRARRAGEWRIHLVADFAELLLLAADLEAEGTSRLCVDPSPNGTGGSTLPVRHLPIRRKSAEPKNQNDA